MREESTAAYACVRTSLSFVRMSLTVDNCFAMRATSISDAERDSSSCSRSGLRSNGARVGVVLRARRLGESVPDGDESSMNATFGMNRRERCSSALAERYFEHDGSGVS